MGILNVLQAASANAATTAAPEPTPTPTPTPVVVAVAEPTTAVALNDAANKALSAMFGGHASKSLAELADELDEGGVRESLPFANLKKGNWKSYTKLPPELLEYMPAGDKPYAVIYLTHRLGALAWSGDSTTKSAPLWGAAVKHPMASELSESLNKQILKVAQKVQFTPKAQKVKFDALGRVAPELHILCWRPDTGFIVLVVSGYDAVRESLTCFKTIGAKTPVVLNVKELAKNNPKATDPAARDWKVFYVDPSIELTPRAKEFNEKFAALERNSTQELANVCVKFAETGDYEGMGEHELASKLAEYAPLL
jgi:hypothetical protein